MRTKHKFRGSRFAASLMVFLGIAFVSSNAYADFITDKTAFLTANPGLNLLDFEGICASGTCAVPTFPGVTFSGPSLVIADGPTFGAPSDWLADNTFGGNIALDFSPNVNAIGFNVSADFTGQIAGQITVNLFSGANLLDVQTFSTTGLSVFDTFAGWFNLGSISNLNITLTSSNDFVNIDNLYFGTVVPEPGTLALLGIGLAGLGLTRRRRKA